MGCCEYYDWLDERGLDVTAVAGENRAKAFRRSTAQQAEDMDCKVDFGTQSERDLGPYPTTGRFITSDNRGSKRNSELSCLASCPLNPFGSAGWGLWLRLD